VPRKDKRYNRYSYKREKESYMLKRILCMVAVSCALFVAVAGFALAADEQKPRTFNVGDKILPFELTNLEGKTVPLPLGSSITAITVFTTACSACQAEMSLLSGLAKQKKDLKVIALCVDSGGAENVKRFMESNKYANFEYYIDPKFEKAQELGFTFSPGLILVKSGEIYFKKAGFMNRYEQEITDKILK